ncbi:hypothetical protein [Bradyrhizobium sp. AUGA SZCCT0160]|uniref:hypothetical protein n=1 Tax=Bradyrhizobium sp. AUGA SZCCT0160 TaxID=2807662 RepID=UPI001BA6D14B|nr:hypothetical protein [Bradyrhizobium sp. AUGA SZCCT0160]MBR1190311.1 hypothetical protein [Bradyrhizobium sp. AUGA SZCCT0160]
MSKRFVSKRFGVGLLLACVAALLLPVLVVLVDMIFLHQTMVNSIYKNVDDVSDSEMPPTVASFQSGPDVVSTIGGSGEGLNCSLPALTNIFFDHRADDKGRRHLVLQRFRQACVFHDLCYRHGLATYGYNQNDCDRIMQNAAFRLCLYIRNGDDADQAARCETDSKMVLAGVSIGGADAYRAWDRSTYFEFDSDPWRSSGFLVSRVVDHPFKSIDREKYHDEPDQVILTFENKRSNLTVTCVTCKAVPVFQTTERRSDVSAELRSVGIERLPDALLKREDQILSNTNPVWLPPRRHHAAPHLLVDGAGKNHLIWVTRNNPGDTISCLVLADAAKLLTHTLPKRDLCSEEAGSQLTMVEVDMYASSPLPMEIPSANGIFAAAISAKREDDRSLSFCLRSASRKVERETVKNDDQADCILLSGPEVSGGAGLGAFQNFAVIRPGQQILFARDIAPSPALLPVRLLQNALGVKYSSKGTMLVIDVTAHSQEKKASGSRIRKTVKFDIDDRFDPMMPITRKRDDLRFLSLESSMEGVGVRMIDFEKESPAVGDVKLMMNGSDVNLHRSWASRPVLVLETREGLPKTKLVFSRAEIAGESASPNAESLSLETLVFERAADGPSDAPFVKTGGAACTVKYKFQSLPDYPCYRPFDPKRPMRASAAARMQASQLLVGKFAGQDGHGIAFPDFCLQGEPIILKTEDGSFAPMTKTVGEEIDKIRTVTCDPLDSHKYISGPIKPGPDVTVSAADRPRP